MASRIVGVGNIIGYLAGYVKLDNFAWFLGTSQFKQLCAIASIALIVTVLLSVLFIKERDPRLEGPPSRNKAGVLAFFRSIFGSIQRLPPEIKKVCIVQFCAWIGFFPMLFYTSQYIAEIYAEPYFEENPNMTDDEITKLYEKATRVGTFALLIFSITSLITNVFLPFFIAPTYDSQPFEIGEGPGQTAAVPLHDYFETEQKSWLDYLVIPGFTLRRAWMYAQILFTVCMLCTVFVRTVAVATVLIGLVGITWALTLWAPWAIISAEISRRDAVTRAQKHRNFSHVSDGEAQDNDRPSLDGYSDNGEDISTAEEGGLRKAKDEPEDADQAGVILGIHNMAIAAPQIIATVVSSIIFRFFQKKRGEPGDHSIAIVMALGGIAVLVSAWFIHRIKESASLPAADLEEAILNAIDEGEMGGIGAVGGDGPHGPGSRPRTPGTPGTPGTLPSRPSTAHSRRQSHESLPRLSLQRATLARSQSFGGAEY
jgi:solute carrier family 45 protein 1/2/4